MCKECLDLRRQLIDARKMLVRLEVFSGIDSWRAPESLKLSPQKEQILQLLVFRDFVSIDMMISFFYQYDMPDYARNNMRVQTHHLRKSLRKIDIDVHSSWGRGYWLNPDDRQKLAEMGWHDRKAVA
ncbi:MAG: hypothetical protein DSY80_10710 [Desulfocapsa sp.]|nr:MAG: hypothetical protein DSY80_10710 [Desulfocapsa sp.]